MPLSALIAAGKQLLELMIRDLVFVASVKAG